MADRLWASLAGAPPTITESWIVLDYPLYACDFDTQDDTRLIAAGGGGSGKTGVRNEITLLNTTNQDEIARTSSLVLPKGEDSVMSLVTGQRKGRSTLLYAGINSSPQNIAKGKNENFKSFTIDLSSKSKANLPPKIAEVHRSTILTTKDPDAYQRIVRLSQPFEGAPQLGACATGSTGLSKEAQIALFDISASGGAPKVRGRLELQNEAVDLDVLQTDAGKFQLAYADQKDLYTLTLGKGMSESPELAYTMTPDEAIGSKVVPVFRSIRYLTPSFILAVANLPQRSGVILTGFRIIDGKARISVNTKLPKLVTQSAGLAVASLSPSTAPTVKPSETQFVIAVAAQSCICLYTLEYQVVSGLEVISRLHPFHTIKRSSNLPLTSIAFSHFHPPTKTTSRTQHLKLASVSLNGTVVVHSIPLRKSLEKATHARRGSPPRQHRYVVALKSRAPSPTSLVIVITIVIVFLAILTQGLLEVRGLSAPIIGARKFTPRSWRRAPHPLTNFPLTELLAEQKLAVGGGGGNVVLKENKEGHEHGIEVAEHDEAEHGPAVEWDELPPEQRMAWRRRLKAAGHWGEEMGETVFKGVLFSEIAGAVGIMVGG